MSDHKPSLEERANLEQGFPEFRAVCSCGKFTSEWTAPEWNAERLHHREHLNPLDAEG